MSILPPGPVLQRVGLLLVLPAALAGCDATPSAPAMAGPAGAPLAEAMEASWGRLDEASRQATSAPCDTAAAISLALDGWVNGGRGRRPAITFRHTGGHRPAPGAVDPAALHGRYRTGDGRRARPPGPVGRCSAPCAERRGDRRLRTRHGRGDRPDARQRQPLRLALRARCPGPAGGRRGRARARRLPPRARCTAEAAVRGHAPCALCRHGGPSPPVAPGAAQARPRARGAGARSIRATVGGRTRNGAGTDGRPAAAVHALHGTGHGGRLSRRRTHPSRPCRRPAAAAPSADLAGAPTLHLHNHGDGFIRDWQIHGGSTAAGRAFVTATSGWSVMNRPGAAASMEDVGIATLRHTPRWALRRPWRARLRTHRGTGRHRCPP